jgi:hypothetical protein
MSVDGLTNCRTRDEHRPEPFDAAAARSQARPVDELQERRAMVDSRVAMLAAEHPSASTRDLGAPRVLRLGVRAGAAIVLLQALYLILIAYTGLSLSRLELATKAPALQRIGSAMATHVNIPTSVVLIVGVALLALPSAWREHEDFMAAPRRLWLVIAQGASILVVIATILGVRATIFFLPPLGHHLSSSQRWELIAYVTGTAGTAVVALVTAFAAMPRRAAHAPLG